MDNSTIEILKQLYQIHKIDLSDIDLIDLIDLEDFTISFAPFVHLINYQSQILALTIAKSSDPNLRKKIILNLFEENCKDLTNVDTFKLFILECRNHKLATIIKEINSDLDSENQIKPNLSIFDTNTDLFDSNPLIMMYKISILNFIETNDFDDCCQMLGTIKYIYHLISVDINAYYKTKTGLEPSNHYTIDKIMDIISANNLFECNSKPINETNLEFGIKWITNSIRSLVYI
jgi:hypothetical protein